MKKKKAVVRVERRTENETKRYSNFVTILTIFYSRKVLKTYIKHC
jgi:hypothetical protein